MRNGDRNTTASQPTGAQGHPAPGTPRGLGPLSGYAGVSGRVLALVVALAVAFGAAFVVAPGPLAASGESGGNGVDQRNLTEALRQALVAY